MAATVTSNVRVLRPLLLTQATEMADDTALDGDGAEDDKSFAMAAREEEYSGRLAAAEAWRWHDKAAEARDKALRALQKVGDDVVRDIIPGENVPAPRRRYTNVRGKQFHARGRLPRNAMLSIVSMI